MHAIAFDQGGYVERAFIQPAPSAGAARPMSEARSAGAPAGFAEMIRAIATRGDKTAFAGLFGHFAPRVKSYMMRLGAPPEQAEELAQETLLSVWRKAGAFDPAKAAPSTWIFAIARNLRIDASRHDRRSEPIEDPSEAPVAEPTPDALVANAEAEVRIREALAGLPPEQAEVVRLSFFSDKPHSEIAEALALPLGTVKSRLRLAVGRLRELLGDLA
jgi:RNA polymerase sigma-70 factor (ECF subfamily)